MKELAKHKRYVRFIKAMEEMLVTGKEMQEDIAQGKQSTQHDARHSLNLPLW